MVKDMQTIVNYCVTVDYDTVNDGCVTVRNRDTMVQERVKIEELKDFVNKKMESFRI